MKKQKLISIYFLLLFCLLACTENNDEYIAEQQYSQLSNYAYNELGYTKEELTIDKPDGRKPMTQEEFKNMKDILKRKFEQTLEMRKRNAEAEAFSEELKQMKENEIVVTPEMRKEFAKKDFVIDSEYEQEPSKD